MGTDNLFHKSKKAKTSRKSNNRPLNVSIRIICEGEKTEPFYFEGLKAHILSNKNNDRNKFDIEILGKGRQTLSLVNEVEQIISSGKIYETTWLVFDFDDKVSDFKQAIDKAESLDCRVAWSHQCFEYWLYLHFHYCASNFSREALFEKMNKILEPFGGYKKNDKDIFEKTAKNNSGLKKALKNAEKIRKHHGDEKMLCPTDCGPCTTVDKLILSLKDYLNDLI